MRTEIARPRKPISIMLAQPSTMPACGLMALVDPTRKPSTMQSMMTGTMRLTGMVDPLCGTGIMHFLPLLPHLKLYPSMSLCSRPMLLSSRSRRLWMPTRASLDSSSRVRALPRANASALRLRSLFLTELMPCLVIQMRGTTASMPEPQPWISLLQWSTLYCSLCISSSIWSAKDSASMGVRLLLRYLCRYLDLVSIWSMLLTNSDTLVRMRSRCIGDATACEASRITGWSSGSASSSLSELDRYPSTAPSESTEW
mmetsp:Transcript_19371/g.43173  ORF Transcript_19371/g.43173 Transcript_19371/m.43173 type:complete len:256 (+) Transcript_19371:405-1172(+)